MTLGKLNQPRVSVFFTVNREAYGGIKFNGIVEIIKLNNINI